MFKTLTSMLFITSLLLFAIISEVAGLYIMIHDVISGGNEFMKGFTLFSLGTLIFIGTSIAYLVTKTIANTEKIANALADLIDHTLDKDAQAAGVFNTGPNPLMDLFKKFPGMNMGSTTINVSSIDEEGNISPMVTKTFDNPEDFLKHRDEIFAKAFGTQPKDAKKKIDDMSIEELQTKEKEASDAEKWELAAAYRDAIKRKTNPNK
jgi:hypothetical protein